MSRSLGLEALEELASDHHLPDLTATSWSREWTKAPISFKTSVTGSVDGWTREPGNVLIYLIKRPAQSTLQDLEAYQKVKIQKFRVAKICLLAIKLDKVRPGRRVRISLPKRRLYNPFKVGPKRPDRVPSHLFVRDTGFEIVRVRILHYWSGSRVDQNGKQGNEHFKSSKSASY
ncbi:hypothetical protein B0F90DRAFT_1667533 [Multifurca ochricompacta]|uniref:Uncharacterized protein n=1 Tax=Multifurca ochricompacta TaxID=376703 RepID=A0AAD4M5N1_9AGAM|nr:hypothetical protein B0F90DRAFT_1667533 [Multifurca ochricompacta]